jgi:Na+/proline symporter
VRDIWTLVIAGLVAAVAITAVLSWRRTRTSQLALGIALGAATGVAASLVVLQPRADLIPDEAEGMVVVAVIVLVSLALIVMTWLRWSRR